MLRRKFIKQAGILVTGIIVPDILKVTKKENPTILVVSGWQDVNIGDIAHTPGLLNILETFLPKAKIILWKKREGAKWKAVQELIKSNFPKVNIIYGDVDKHKNVDNKEVQDAFKGSDIFIHGSGPSVVGEANLQAWVKKTNKPFGIFGTTIENIDSELKTLLEKASFIYTRETKSLEVLNKAGISDNSTSFAPDATFFLDIHNQKKANNFLSRHNLEEKKFICAIPRLRYTPYHEIRKVVSWSKEKVREVEETNEKFKEIDHSKLRQAMIMWVRETGNKVLVCPEMTYQVDVMDELLIDPLPDDVKPNVIKRGYWMPDEAASIYAKAHTVLSFECHSPIIAVANGTPAFYLRQPEDTIKGQMWYDLNFDDWIFEIEETEGNQISDQLKGVWDDYNSAKKYVSQNMSKVNEIYAKSCKEIRKFNN